MANAVAIDIKSIVLRITEAHFFQNIVPHLFAIQLTSNEQLVHLPLRTTLRYFLQLIQSSTNDLYRVPYRVPFC